VKAINKALDILELFLKKEGELGLSELSKLSGINIATANRIASVLVKRGYLKQRVKRGKYALGTIFLDFSGIIRGRVKMRDIALPLLNRLSQKLDETVLLVSWDGQEGTHTETVHADHALRIVPDEGTKFNLHSTGVGKVILANLSDAELESCYRDKKLERHTSNTVTNLDDLKRHLVAVREEGVGYDDEEQYLGVRNVAAAIKDNTGGVVGAIGVIGPTVRLGRERMKEVVPDVKACALEISRAMGYRGD
jgi:IclR family acetate operon transcriptional repressor